ncbi:uncharacterized protein LOC123443583 isoform X3 [Hordeum vulgare subsp. vulgare]|uniref:Predicted protein n=1 Tax=Hordeum vulgare subsp. vulgare TaxID=112509 RepID=F2EF85_HORVV|nr:uncharacterized protein LOC123443583 isoform X3 [Hordeum vulgare subsp. vulgare]XP_044975947.1 uncharacterized protein LOC123443583 isoform X3 [Hordeum vulgare subsp. vulgare]XP_044975948.1 uncharacterized protein LOC123443583 isoform X3 [Hordeum vulgare subsp. vulgare]XP_044975949.1 uncharacterized protein LOC123443583 isoform X3 [Hordeum vulgare subsp. vulgare]BAK06007.1 predicted protein [Hordeum vulgare subsp. vulgare]
MPQWKERLIQLAKYGNSQLNQVISVKVVDIALKLSFNGVNQFIYIQTCDYMLFSATELFKQGCRTDVLWTTILT